MTTANTTTTTSIDNNEATVGQYSISKIGREFKNDMNQNEELLKDVSENGITLESAKAIVALLTPNIVFANKTGKNKKRRTQLELAQDHVKDIRKKIEFSTRMIKQANEKIASFKNKDCSLAKHEEFRIKTYSNRLYDLYEELKISEKCLKEIEQA